MSGGAPTGVLFVCLGNICRSPLAEGLFLHRARERGVLDRFDVDSAGTGGWHEGERADPRMRALAESRGVELPSLARPVRLPEDVDRFPVILCMDRDNLETLHGRGIPASQARLYLSVIPELGTDEVPDPYYGGPEGFERVWDLAVAATDAWIDQLT